MWKHSDSIIKHNSNIQLKEFRVEKIHVKGKNLILEAPKEGFFILVNDEQNKDYEIFKTKKAEIHFCGYDKEDVSFSVYKMSDDDDKVNVENISFNTLIKNVNSGKYFFEFDYDCYSTIGAVFLCKLFIVQENGFCDKHSSQFSIQYDELKCFWNEVRKFS